MIDVSRPDETLAYLLGLPAELPKVEFKRLSDKMAAIFQTVCAFANADGGCIVLGLGDPKHSLPGAKPTDRLYGVEEKPELFDQLASELRTRFDPPIDGIFFDTLPCQLRDGRAGHLRLLNVPASEGVHSLVNGGTWIRGGASNRQLGARETAELSQRRGDRSAEVDLLPISLSLLDTDTWRTYASARALRQGTIGDQLMRIGLADRVDTINGSEILPRRAAVVLFAEDPGGLLAANGSRADVRLFVYTGKEVGTAADPNFRKAPRTIRGPLVELIEETHRAVLAELAGGLTLVGSGFKSRHKYPERVVIEAIVNAVIHRDYGLNRDIVIRILEDRIVVESPGAFPGRITPQNIKSAGSKARNPLIARNLREFPRRPNFDAGEGVPMMFSEMEAEHLYPPQYQLLSETAVAVVALTLLNEERPAAWLEVSDWIDRHGPIANADVCKIAKVQTLKASRMLGDWVESGLLERLPGRGRRNAAYTKPSSRP